MKLDRVHVHYDQKGSSVYSFRKKEVADVIWEHWVGSPSKFLKTVACSASWMRVFGEMRGWVDDVGAICTNRAQIIQLPKALYETKELTGKVGSFCIDPTLENFSEAGFSAAKASSKWADFFAGVFFILKNPLEPLCKTIKSGLSCVVDLKKIYKSLVAVGELEEGDVAGCSKQIGLSKNIVAFVSHGLSFVTRVLSVVVSPIVALVLGTLSLIMDLVDKIFDADVENTRQYQECLRLQSATLQPSSL